jgi:serine/threonine protein kinase
MINKDRWEKVEDIYHAALERDPDARDSFLAEACGSDEELRTEVDSLLQYDSASADFIETPAIQLEAQAIANEQNEEFLIKEIGPYRIESIISRGGMGDVFLAVDQRLDRKVAIKLLSTQFTADSDRIARFKQEARTTSTLSHPNIVTLFEIGEIDDRHYIVTEYVEGETLRQRIAAAPAHQIALHEALSIAIQVVDALAAAHQAGVVHRDIKPENIIIRKDGLVKVLDFGIAKLTVSESEIRGELLTTQTGIIMGTASYMSPEQARGQKVDHRTDIFSIGAMLYEMLSGSRPFQGETAADVMAAVLIKQPTPLNLLVPNIPTSMQRVVERCLEKAPDGRFQTASDLGFLLQELNVEPAKTAAKPPSTTFSVKRVGTLLAFVLAVIVISWALTLKKQPSTTSSPPPKKPSPEFTNRLVWFDRTGNQLGTAGPPGEYTGPALSPNDDRLVVSLTDPKTNKRDLWIFPSMSENGFRLTTDPADDLNPVWTPDGKWIIYTSDKNGVRNIYRIAADGTGAAESLLVSNQTMNVEDISQDGKLVMFNTGSNNHREPNLALLSLDSRTANPYRLTEKREDCGRLSPNRQWVVYRSYETDQSEIFVRAISASGRATGDNLMVSSGRGSNTQPTWKGDGKSIYYLDHKILTEVELSFDGTKVTAGPPKALFNAKIEDSEHRNRFVVTKDGERFLVVVREESKPAR